MVDAAAMDAIERQAQMHREELARDLAGVTGVAGVAAALTRRTSIAERLEHEPVVWLSTTRPDGRPHIVPVWFMWDGESITFFSKPHAQKVKNLQANPNVMLAIGVPDEDMDVELIEGRAEVLTESASEMAPGRLEKYAALMARVGLTVEQFVETYSQVVRIRPTRFLGWGGAGWVSETAGAS